MYTMTIVSENWALAATLFTLMMGILGAYFVLLWYVLGNVDNPPLNNPHPLLSQNHGDGLTLQMTTVGNGGFVAWRGFLAQRRQSHVWACQIVPESIRVCE